MPNKQDLGVANAVNMLAKEAHGVFAFTQTISGLTAGTDAEGYLAYHPVLGAKKTRIGKHGDTSLSDSNSCFVTEVAEITDISTNGDYYLNHATGYYKIKPAKTSATLTYYSELMQVAITPSSQASVYKTTAYAASGVIKNSAGSFYGLFGYNSKTSDQYLQLHDATSVPADSEVPVAVIAIPAESTFSIDCQMAGIPFSTGIVWCNSSTGPTKTIGSADVFLTALYL